VEAIAESAEQAQLPPASRDTTKVHLLIIDMQVDFCHPGGSLFVPGAEDDIRRVIRFIYHNAERITHITCSLDSHYPYQIFHGAWWLDKEGKHPEPFTVITAEDVKNGKWRPVKEVTWSRSYVEKLSAQAKKDLLIWPYHVPIGGIGNALDPELWSAVFWHALARGYQPTLWRKGSIPKTEHYSILRPEIEVPDHHEGGLSRNFLALLETFDYILIAGEAETHCVLETVEDLVNEFGDNPEQLERIFILRDCMSPVPHPDIDFSALAVEQFAAFEQQGVRFINSIDPLPF
jgi:nicotinamidase-related amidase